MAIGRDIAIRACDGQRLAATAFEPDRPNGSGIVVAGAVGIRRHFYRRFATRLAQCGFLAVTFDYRGMGDSAPHGRRRTRAHLREWGEQDLPAVYDWQRAQTGRGRLVHVGHSIGGHLLGLLPARQPDAVLLVATPSGYWRDLSGWTRWGAAVACYGLIPASGRLLGVVPGWAYGGGDPLPAAIGVEWARLMRRSGYVLAYGAHVETALRTLAVPVCALSFADDALAPPTSVARFLSWLGGEPTHRVISPQSQGLRRIGHTGYFRETCRPLWDEAIAWLEGGMNEPPG